MINITDLRISRGINQRSKELVGISVGGDFSTTVVGVKQGFAKRCDPCGTLDTYPLELKLEDRECFPKLMWEYTWKALKPL